MNLRMTKATAVTLAAMAFVIVPGTYLVAWNAATKLVASFGTTQAASRSNGVALEAEAFKDVIQLGGFVTLRDAGTEPAAAAKAVGGVEPVGHDMRVR